MQSVQPPAPGETLDRYQIARQVAAGTPGMLFEAIDLQAQRKVALRWLSPLLATSPQAMQRFRTELLAASQLVHPNLVGMRRLGEVQGHPFVISEWVENAEPLSSWLASRPRLGPDQACRIAMSLLKGLAAAHALGLQHRDLRPENILLDAEATPRIADLALARFAIEAEAANRVSAATTMLSSMRFASPEQLHGRTDLDASVDIYAVGVLLFSMLTGRLPYLANNPIDLALAVRLPPPSIQDLVPALSSGLGAVVSKALATHASERHASADLFGVALEPFAGNLRYYDLPESTVRTPSVRPYIAPGAEERMRGRGEWRAVSPQELREAAASVRPKASATGSVKVRRETGERSPLALNEARTRLRKWVAALAIAGSLLALALVVWIVTQRADSMPAEKHTKEAVAPISPKPPDVPPSQGSAADDWGTAEAK